MTVAAAIPDPPVGPRYVLAPYVATPHEVVDRMLDPKEVCDGDAACDLGCGDGRIAIAAARRGARGIGDDIEPHRIERARVVSHSFALKSPEPVRTERFVDGVGTSRTIRLWRIRAEVERGAAEPPGSAS